MVPRSSVAKCPDMGAMTSSGDAGCSACIAFELEQATEGALPHDLLLDVYRPGANSRTGDPKGWARVAPRGALEHLERCDRAAACDRVRQQVERVEQQPAGLDRHPRRVQRGVPELVAVIEHDTPTRRTRLDPCSRAAERDPDTHGSRYGAEAPRSADRGRRRTRTPGPASTSSLGTLQCLMIII